MAANCDSTQAPKMSWPALTRVDKTRKTVITTINYSEKVTCAGATPAAANQK